ncbi:MAG: nucleotide exchange factor GrpE [Deltaproteobacteria bacterium]|nr:nucleotide exchange factor GrpE [Deltaproteobacteria bacterium]
MTKKHTTGMTDADHSKKKPGRDDEFVTAGSDSLFEGGPSTEDLQGNEDSTTKIQTVEDSPPADEEKEDAAALLAAKEEELRSTYDRLLRVQADYENYKKRMVREREDLLKFGNESLIKELLPIIDNLELSLDHAPAVDETGTMGSFIKGIEMIKNEFIKKLEKCGLRAVPAQGERFDPTKHEATTMVETSEYPDNTIVEELQKGYFIHDRLIRPSGVSVASSPRISEGESRDSSE